VGFVVSRTVGPAVVRNRVLRRLRHLMAARLDRLPVGSRVVVRAFAPAAGATSGAIASALDRALDQALRGSRSGTLRSGTLRAGTLQSGTLRTGEQVSAT
jgi:ribonuclease P protein component